MTATEKHIHDLAYVIGAVAAVLDSGLLSDRQKVERAREVLAAHHDSGGTRRPRDTDWRGAVDGWLTHLRAGGASAASLKLRRSYLTRLAGQHPAGPAAVTSDQLAAFMARPGWSPETRKSARSTIRGFYAWAHDTGIVAVDPSLRLPAVHVPAGAPRPAPMAVVERAWMVGTDRDRLMVACALLAGLRRAEIAAVHTRDITETSDGPSLRVRGKGGRVRVVPLHPLLARLLADAPAGFVFPGRIDGHLSPAHVGKRLIRLLGQGWTAHTLRHAFATRAYATEHDLRAVQQLLGHSTPTTTARYTAVPDGSLRRAVHGSAGASQPSRTASAN